MNQPRVGTGWVDPTREAGRRSRWNDQGASPLERATAANGGRLPTVAQVLELDVMRAGSPIIGGGASGLDRPVRWVHVSEVPDIGDLLRGGELLLTTGIALPDSPAELISYVHSLAEAGASGLVVELVRRYHDLPAVLSEAGDRYDLPVVGLRREVRFVTITEAVHSVIIDARVTDLRSSERVRQALQPLATEGASIHDVVERMARLAGCPVVLESIAHRVLDYDLAASSEAEVLDDWESRSRRAHGDPDSLEHPWLSIPVGARGEVWGRLVLLPGHHPTNEQRRVLEEGANTLAVMRLIEHREPLDQRAQRSLVDDVLERRFGSEDEIHVRAAAIGVPTRGRTLHAMVLWLRDGANPRDLVASVQDTLRTAGVSALIAPQSGGTLALVLTLAPNADPWQSVDTVAAAVRRHLADVVVSVGAGEPLRGWPDLRRGLNEATSAARAGTPPAAPPPPVLAGELNLGTPASGARPLLNPSYLRVADIRLRGLLRLLADNVHLQRFVERELGPLLAHDHRHNTRLLEVLGTYLEAGGNKSLAATRSHLSRAAFYQHMERVARVLGADPEDPESRTSLHVALLAYQALERHPAQ
jgi:purine catabolism regulator